MDKDLQSVQQARDLLAAAERAQERLAGLTQKQVDAICEAMVEAGYREAERLGRMAAEETGMGRPEHKKIKNEFGTRGLWERARDLKTVGIIRRDETRMMYEIAEPVGVIAAVVPTTNPTSTAMCKAISAVKARNAIVVSPHPRAVRCVAESCRVISEAALAAGAPEGTIGCMTVVTLQGTQELMRHRITRLILATGGAGLVEAAYSSGKPAYGVGPGNVPVIVERTADVRRAVEEIVASQGFDWGTLCCSEQSLIIDAPVREAVVEELRKRKAYFVSDEEKRMLERVAVKGRLMNPDVVGKAPHVIAKMAGFTVPEDTTLLLAWCKSVGWEEPLSCEILAPILSVYVEDGWERCCERAIEVLRFGGMGHTLGLHTRTPEVAMEFAMKKPAMRVLLNMGTSLGAVGATSGLFPSMTLGCGTWGGNITSDNIGPQNLINVKRFCLSAADPWAPEMARRVSEGLVSGFVPFGRREPAAKPAPGSAAAAAAGPYGPRELEEILIYNGRRRDLRSL